MTSCYGNFFTYTMCQICLQDEIIDDEKLKLKQITNCSLAFKKATTTLSTENDDSNNKLELCL